MAGQVWFLMRYRVCSDYLSNYFLILLNFLHEVISLLIDPQSSGQRPSNYKKLQIHLLRLKIPLGQELEQSSYSHLQLSDHFKSLKSKV